MTSLPTRAARNDATVSACPSHGTATMTTSAAAAALALSVPAT
jgi:hypothetical protein